MVTCVCSINLCASNHKAITIWALYAMPVTRPTIKTWLCDDRHAIAMSVDDPRSPSSVQKRLLICVLRPILCLASVRGVYNNQQHHCATVALLAGATLLELKRLDVAAHLRTLLNQALRQYHSEQLSHWHVIYGKLGISKVLQPPCVMG